MTLTFLISLKIKIISRSKRNHPRLLQTKIIKGMAMIEDKATVEQWMNIQMYHLCLKNIKLATLKEDMMKI